MRKTVEIEPGVVIGKNQSGRLCVAKARYNSWTVAQRGAFLDHLAATCNVRASAKAVGLVHSTGYRMYRRDSDFAAAWDNALAAGYTALETMMVARALGAVDIPHGETQMPDVETIDTEVALRMLALHKRAVKTNAGQGKPKLRQSTEEETNAAILKKLRALAKRRGIEIE
jgi:uncharacterized membrane protein